MGFPVPQTSTSGLRVFTALTNLITRALRAWVLLGLVLSKGPYMFGTITLAERTPYWEW